MSNAYLTYAAKRLGQAVVVILLAYVFTFVVVSILPGDPITSVLRNPQNGFTEQEIAEIIAAQGLDRPVLVQLWSSLSGFLTGDLGMSMRSNRPVATLIAEVLPSTLILASTGLAVALILAMAVAYGTQVVPKRYGQGLLRAFPSLFLSTPNFVIGLILIHLFGFQLRLFRVIEPDSFWATVFAAITIGIPFSAQIAEVLIANLDREAEQEYAAVARSRGIGQARLFAQHLLKPASLPVVTVIAITVGELLGNSLITESVFGRTGLGSLVQRSVSTQDLPVLQAIVSLGAVVFVLVNLIADLLYPLLDPRVQILGARKPRLAITEDSSTTTKAVTP
ncbi:ABC transporter permease [Rhizobium rhizogenes]|uniref:ABC transporter permease n=2 Tax=Rhizobium/Agrobacterium group TaxID=227290 RepID=A0AA86KRX4_AGRTU|nr:MULTISPECIES: ABC transporter permease [Rhizobium/Agrobacterium group]AHK03776.1 ABC transporter permease protein [Agrobacterium tumefaciens LBA4213 (Ach5)]AKC09537.1 ABC transporter permease [Agrobacterium tumefaciens]EHJ95900.1 oligopeptide ABC transporter membrane spanning protein [Agrobacterium tumefaciens 5A]HCV72366.1 ABC transporter permease [Agrobacterium sp.]ADY67079.1 oligopeptide ABC transporter membrane spanning protein [Agrobacterium tumefaciens]